jgi:hypothetical protein
MPAPQPLANLRYPFGVVSNGAARAEMGSRDGSDGEDHLRHLSPQAAERAVNYAA